jgi:DNA processing protein
VVVLASGVDQAYPSAHASLFDQCRETGLVISEAPPGEPARRWRFLARNRVIAALTRATVVVEAAHRSGALNTARCAADLGRHVFGVPGPVSSTASAGVHALIRSGATLVTNADEVVAGVNCESATEVTDLAQSLARLGAEAAATLRALADEGVADLAALARRLGISVPDVTADLAGLELAGFVERHTRGWRVTEHIKEHLQRHDTVQMLDFT